MAKLAYCSSGQPGRDEEPFLKVIATALGEADHANLDVDIVAPIRRAWYEAHTIAVAEIKSQCERTEKSEPVKMAGPERESS